MAKWKCEICNREFDNFHAQGFNHKIYCPLCYFKELYKREKSKNTKAIKYIEKNRVKATPLFKQFDGDLILPHKEVDNLLNILRGEE